MANPPVDVQALGQSIWVDNIRRKLLNDGTFHKYIDEMGVVGVTSNPTIFQKAIGGSDDYDADIMGNLDLETEEMFWKLAIDDIRQAADLFKPVYERTGGVDGYVSLEVSPHLAHKADETAAEAKRLFAEINRPNVMIKIPATAAGIPAIEEAIYSGVNVNVTLIFSVQNYIEVAEAYIKGLERRAAEGKSVKNIASVASFFISRIDGMIDPMLQNNVRAAQGRDLDSMAINNKLMGKAAIANAKVAYKKFEDLFYGERFAALKTAGAWVQRPLWASTSTKNPAYPDTLYVDSLIGKDTVNTLPPDTLKAFADHGTASETISVEIDLAPDVLKQLADVGIDIDLVTKRLQEDGVESFSESFDALMQQLEAKRTALASGIISSQSAALGIYSEAFSATLKQIDAEFINTRLWAKDASIWKNHGPTMQKIEQRLGWLDTETTIDIARLKALQAEAKGKYTHVVLLGMGGSSLAPEVLSMTFGSAEGYPKLLVLDSTNPDQVAAVEAQIALETTLFIVSSKSGGTIETQAFYNYFYAKTGGRGEQFIAITDPGTVLGHEAREKKFKDLFENPADIGGRYSALSYFGMVPAALLGIDLDLLARSAAEMMKASGKGIAAALNPAAYLGVLMGVLALKGRDKVVIFTSPSIASFGSWAEQLIAESTGKEGKGVVPIVGTTVGKPHDYASDRLFVFIKVQDDPDNDQLSAQIRALREAGHPRLTLIVKDKYALGGEFFRWEYATAIAGKVLGVNPFDEPNVTESKQNTARLLDYYKENGSLPAAKSIAEKNGVKLYADKNSSGILRELVNQHNFDKSDMVHLLAAHLAGTSAGDYFSLLAYLPTTPETDAALNDLRRRLRHVTKRAVTAGYGPRYLHSTGQLHKGGANIGVFLLLTATPATDMPIPDMPFSFGTLSAAQAAGDFEALDAHKCRAVRLDFGDDIAVGLAILTQAVDLIESRRS